jgi:tetratricopeptide (TPR) repeat protein
LAQLSGRDVAAALSGTTAPVVYGAVITGILDRTIRIMGSGGSASEADRNRSEVMRPNLGRVAEYLDGLPTAEPVVRQPFELGIAAMRACRWDEAIGHFREAMTLTGGVHVVALLNLTGVCHYTRGRPDEALRDFVESARLAVQLKAKRGRAQALNNIGLVCRDNGELDTALEYLHEALAIAHEFDDQWAVAIQLGNIGNVWHDKGELDRALEYHEQALTLSREIGDRWGVASQLSNIGSAYREKGELDKALVFDEEALAMARRVGYRLGVVTGLGNIGAIYRDKGELERALEYEEEALAMARSAGYSLGVAIDLGNIGLFLTEGKRHEQAVPKLAEALTILLATGVADGQRQALTGLVRCEDKLGRRRVEGLLKGAGLDDGSVNDLLDRIDQVRMRRPEP